MAEPIYTASNSAQGFPFLHTFTNICYLLLFFFYDRHPKMYEVISHYVFPDDFSFPDDYWG